MNYNLPNQSQQSVYHNSHNRVSNKPIDFDQLSNSENKTRYEPPTDNHSFVKFLANNPNQIIKNDTININDYISQSNPVNGADDNKFNGNNNSEPIRSLNTNSINSAATISLDNKFNYDYNGHNSKSNNPLITDSINSNAGSGKLLIPNSKSISSNEQKLNTIKNMNDIINNYTLKTFDKMPIENSSEQIDSDRLPSVSESLSYENYGENTIRNGELCDTNNFNNRGDQNPYSDECGQQLQSIMHNDINSSINNQNSQRHNDNNSYINNQNSQRHIDNNSDINNQNSQRHNDNDSYINNSGINNQNSQRHNDNDSYINNSGVNNQNWQQLLNTHNIINNENNINHNNYQDYNNIVTNRSDNILNESGNANSNNMIHVSDREILHKTINKLENKNGNNNIRMKLDHAQQRYMIKYALVLIDKYPNIPKVLKETFLDFDQNNEINKDDIYALHSFGKMIIHIQSNIKKTTNMMAFVKLFSAFVIGEIGRRVINQETLFGKRVSKNKIDKFLNTYWKLLFRNNDHTKQITTELHCVLYYIQQLINNNGNIPLSHPAFTLVQEQFDCLINSIVEIFCDMLPDISCHIQKSLQNPMDHQQSDGSLLDDIFKNDSLDLTDRPKLTADKLNHNDNGGLVQSVKMFEKSLGIGGNNDNTDNNKSQFGFFDNNIDSNDDENAQKSQTSQQKSKFNNDSSIKSKKHKLDIDIHTNIKRQKLSQITS